MRRPINGCKGDYVYHHSSNRNEIKIICLQLVATKICVGGNGLCAKNKASMKWKQEIRDTTETLLDSYKLISKKAYAQIASDTM